MRLGETVHTITQFVTKVRFAFALVPSRLTRQETLSGTAQGWGVFELVWPELAPAAVPKLWVFLKHLSSNTSPLAPRLIARNVLAEMDKDDIGLLSWGQIPWSLSFTLAWRAQWMSSTDTKECRETIYRSSCCMAILSRFLVTYGTRYRPAW